MMPRVLAVMAIADLINCRVTALKISTATTVTSLSGATTGRLYRQQSNMRVIVIACDDEPCQV